MPEPRSKARPVPSRRTQQQKGPAPRPAPDRFAAVFKLDDPAERRAFDWMQHFHGPDTGWRLLDVARARAAEGQPADVIMLTECPPEPGEQRPSWAVFRFEVAEIRVSWRTFGLAHEARAAFSAAVNTPPHLLPRAGSPNMSPLHRSADPAQPDAQDAPARTMSREHRSAEPAPVEVAHG